MRNVGERLTGNPSNCDRRNFHTYAVTLYVMRFTRP